jgi:hypothetical protein
MIKRSLSNTSFEFKPIKLKSLQEARNEKKSSLIRKFFINPSELSGLSQVGVTSRSLRQSPDKHLNKSQVSAGKAVIKSTTRESAKVYSRQNSNGSITALYKSRLNPKLQPKTLSSSPSKPLKSQNPSKPSLNRATSSQRSLSIQKSSSILDILHPNKHKKLSTCELNQLLTRLQGKTRLT